MTPEERAFLAAWKICSAWDGKITKPVLRKAVAAALKEIEWSEAKALEAAYTAGFKASAQGWNGEHGCETDTDPDFLKGRDDFVRSLRSLAEENKA